jgi:preprotein translocase subunit Sec63
LFERRYKDGGLTKGQIIILFTHASEDDYNRLRTQALFNASAVGGHDPGEYLGVKKRKAGHQSLPDQSSKFPVFEHPDKYKDLSEDERKARTEQMMRAHKAWANALTDFGKD